MNVQVRDTEEIVTFFRIASKYNCKDALNAVAKLMLSDVNIGNAIILYEASKEFKFPQLTSASKQVCFWKIFVKSLKSDFLTK